MLFDCDEERGSRSLHPRGCAAGEIRSLSGHHVTQEFYPMKNFAYLIAGVSAVVAYFVARKQQSNVPERVEVLAHELQAAWADHHTVV